MSYCSCTGDGNFGKDGRVRIYTYKECVLLSNSIKENCFLKCEVIYDRINNIF